MRTGDLAVDGRGTVARGVPQLWKPKGNRDQVPLAFALAVHKHLEHAARNNLISRSRPECFLFEEES